jgi:hypothetical protein
MTRPGRPKRSLVWDGTERRAQEIEAWARNSAFNTRWQYNTTRAALGHDEVARVLIERDYPESDEWVVVPVGSTLSRSGDDPDEPIHLEVPA